MSNQNDHPVYLDSSPDYTAWLLQRILEDRAESAPLEEASDE
jgi:hypothetical protein